jgi:hypothetical protein
MMYTLRVVALAALTACATLIVLSTPGCTADGAKLSEVIKESDAAIERLDNAREQAVAEKATASPEEAEKIDKRIKAIDETRSEVSKARDLAAKTVNPDGTINLDGAVGAAGAAAFAVNPILGIGVTLLGPLVVGLVQQQRLRKQREAAESVIRSVDYLKVSEPNVAEAFKANAVSISAIQGSDGKRLVDAVQEKKP